MWRSSLVGLLLAAPVVAESRAAAHCFHARGKPLALPAEGSTAQPAKILYDTDMTLDVVVVGALAVIHALADRGEAELLAVNYNEVHEDGVAAIDAVNTWYGRTVPIGAFKGHLESPDASRYLASLAAFPHTATAATAPSALDVYRTVLAEQRDASVTLISVGFLNNLADLLRAERSLVARKVRCLVAMGGLRDDGFNFVRHGLVDSSAFVIENWPTPLVVSDFGGDVRTGTALADAPGGNPVREAYFRWFRGAYRGRSSWDQIAVLFGVRGAGDLFEVVESGQGRLPNGYTWDLRPNWRMHFVPRRETEVYVRLIDDLMRARPGAATGGRGER